MMDEKQNKLIGRINRLKTVRGKNNSLISLYIAGGKSIAITVDYLKSFIKRELNETKNVKDKSNRKAIITTLGWILNDVHKLRECPSNGIAFLYGIGVEDDKEIEVKEMLIPNKSITSFKYHCGADFLLAPIEETLKANTKVLIILLEGGKFACGYIQGKHLKILQIKDFFVPSKIKAGGMSAKRFEKLRKEQLNVFYDYLIDYLQDNFIDCLDEIELIVFGGNFVRVGEFLKKNFDYRLQAKISPEIIRTSEVGEYGFREVMRKIGTVIKNHEILQEQTVWEDFVNHLVKEKATYGLKECLDALREGRVKTMLVHETLIEKITGFEDTVLFSSHTETGEQLLAFGGIAAILRW